MDSREPTTNGGYKMQINESPQVFKNISDNSFFVTYVNGSGYFKDNGTILGQTINNYPTGLSLRRTESIPWKFLIPLDDVVLANHIINLSN